MVKNACSHSIIVALTTLNWNLCILCTIYALKLRTELQCSDNKHSLNYMHKKTPHWDECVRFKVVYIGQWEAWMLEKCVSFMPNVWDLKGLHICCNKLKFCTQKITSVEWPKREEIFWQCKCALQILKKLLRKEIWKFQHQECCSTG